MYNFALPNKPVSVVLLVITLTPCYPLTPSNDTVNSPKPSPMCHLLPALTAKSSPPSANSVDQLTQCMQSLHCPSPHQPPVQRPTAATINAATTSTLDMLTKRVAEMKLPQLPLQQVAGQWQLLLETISYQHQTNSATSQNKATNHKDGCHKLKHNGWLPSQENLPPTGKQRGDGSCRPYKINMASTTNHPMPIAIADTGITTVKTRG